MFVLLLMLRVLSCCGLVLCISDGGPSNPVFDLDHTSLEKNIAAVFNKVAHSSATTKRSVPAYEAQISVSTALSTVPSSLTTTTMSPMRHPGPLLPRATAAPPPQDSPSYAPPSRTLFTPPLPPDYSNPFADKPTLRGTNTETHYSARRPVPPPSMTSTYERIPFRPPDLVEGLSYNLEKSKMRESEPKTDYSEIKNTTNDFVPSLQFTSISRILSGSNGRKQEIPDILLKPMPTKLSHHVPSSPVHEPPITTTTTTTTERTTTVYYNIVTHSTIFNLPNTRRQQTKEAKEEIERVEKNIGIFPTEVPEMTDMGERFPYPQNQPPASSDGNRDDIMEDERGVVPRLDVHPLESTWRIAWSFHVYIAATMFTLIALYSIYKIVRFNDATNLLTQSYFLSVHLILTVVCTLRCFHLFYDAYNLGRSLPESLSRILMFLPAPLLSTAFASLVLYIARFSESPALTSKFLSPPALVMSSTVYTLLCVCLHVFGHVLGYQDDARILPLICQCIYIVISVTLGLCYMYVYRVVKSQINVISNKSVGSQMVTDPTTLTFNSAVTTTIATAMLFILMGFVQLYGIFGVQERPQPYPWLWWGWQFSVRLIELAMCGLLAWVASLTQYPLREKQMQPPSAHTGFALFPCGSSTSTENMDDVLYPAICSTNHAVQNYAMRTGKQVYDDSFPLNTLPDHLNITGTFERHSTKKSDPGGHFLQEARGSLGRRGNDVQTLRNSDLAGMHGLAQKLENPPASGSTMLVAEDGFVRFRNLGAEEDEESDCQSPVGTLGRANSSLAGSVRYNARPGGTIHHYHKPYSHTHQHPATHQPSHSNTNHGHHYQRHHQVYNNT